MAEAKAVIGAGYGDEGKGLMTDFFARQGADMVVRFNGGAQAGHTVQLPDGTRHVFHQIGSGALSGVRTHLARHSIFNPSFFNLELANVRALNVAGAMTADPRVLVTTPYDLLLNQLVEIKRGNARHGSCGLGIGETVERCLRPAYALSMGEIFGAWDPLKDRLRTIRDQWVPQRMEQLGITELPSPYDRFLIDDQVIDSFVEACRYGVAEEVSLVNDKDVNGNIVFEGAQGLMLDQDYGFFPHVTRSNTGLKNIAEFCAEAGISALDVTYVSRAYKTRHGAGPLLHADVEMPWLAMDDPTNAPNKWQGSIRTAPLDVVELRSAIEHDMKAYGDGLNAAVGISLTCMDQIVGDTVEFYAETRHSAYSADFPAHVQEITGKSVRYLSYGPTRSDIRAF